MLLQTLGRFSRRLILAGLGGWALASTGTRAAAEFVVHGTYIGTDPGVPKGTPEASGQTYTLPAGAFFTLRDGRVARISNHYNLGDWVRQVGG